MTEEQKKLKESWLQIMAILRETGYDYLYMEDISRVAAVIRKEIGLDKQNSYFIRRCDMAKKLYQAEFIIKNTRFYITDNYNRNEYEGKYKLMWYLNDFDSWGRVTTDDSMRNLYEHAKTVAM